MPASFLVRVRVRVGVGVGVRLRLRLGVRVGGRARELLDGAPVLIDLLQQDGHVQPQELAAILRARVEGSG